MIATALAAEVRRIADMIDVGRATPADIAEASRLHAAHGIATGSGVYRHHVHAKGEHRAPTIALPESSPGMGPLARRLAEELFAAALNDPPFPVAEWAGPVRRLKPADLFFAADRLCETGECSSVRAMLEAARQVAKYYKVR